MKRVGRDASQYGNRVTGEVSEEKDIIPVHEMLCGFKTRDKITQGDNAVYVGYKSFVFYCHRPTNIRPNQVVPESYQYGTHALT